MCDHHDNKNRYGSAVEHGAAHEKDHKRWSRRTFMKGLGLAGGAGILLGNTPVSALAASPFGFLINNSPSDRILVLIRLKGGNDGLNTFIPLYNYDTYLANRPQLSISQNNTIGLSNEIGMHPNLQDLMPLWESDRMKVVNSVGYPDHNLSHFRSTDIWNSASDTNVVDESGWLGRFIENEYPDYLTNPPETPPAVQIGSVGSILFNGAEGDLSNYAFSVTDPEELFEIAQTGQLYDLENLPDCYYGEQLGYMRTVVNNTFRYAEVINQAYENSSNSVNYNSSLGNQLSLVARLIKGGLGCKFYVVSLDGFDTHANQLGQHANLMNNLSTAINSFYDDLAVGEWDKQVLSMTFSEFGRRVQQNASQGTDHGTAAPLMLFGPGLNGSGIVGNGPDLDDLDPNGNMKHTIDFRQIYKEVLEKWLCIDPLLIENILGQSFDGIDLGLSCEPTVSSPSLPGYQFVHEARYASDGTISIMYTLPATKYVKVEIFNILGQPIQTLYRGRQERGEYKFDFQGGSRFAPTSYVYRIEVNGQAYSRVIMSRM